jgi:simple sugar transport system permease protein
MSETKLNQERFSFLQAAWLRQLWESLKMPLLAILSAFLVGAVVILVTSGSVVTVYEAYEGMIRGALFKQRGLSESLVATIPYILLSLAVAVGFKSGLFNIGAEGQFYIGAIGAAWAGVAFGGLPAILHLPLALLAGALGGAAWASIAGFLKARTGAHEVISTMMLNYVSFRLSEFLVSGPLRDPAAGIVQTRTVAIQAELWNFHAIPERLQDPLNALAAALGLALVTAFIARWYLMSSPRTRDWKRSLRRRYYWGVGAVSAVIYFLVLPPLTNLWWPFTDTADRLHIGLLLAVGMAIFIWGLLQRTTIGFELRTVGANANAARYAGISITRNIMVAMAISGGLAGLAGTIEVLGVSSCRCLPLFFSSGYGWDSIGIALLARNHPIGIIASSFLFGAMRNGADLMELTSGVSKYIISLLQALVLLFVAAPAIVRWVYRIKEGRGITEAPITRGWGG